MPLTKEQLMIPRYLIIADYPFNTDYPIGKIVLVPTDGYAENENGHPVFYCDFGKFPHLFRRLEWWEYRTAEEMPEYCVTHFDSIVFKIEKWILSDSGNWKYETTSETTLKLLLFDFVDMENLTPATLEEYEEYQKQKQ